MRNLSVKYGSGTSQYLHDFMLEVARGNDPQFGTVNKFGENPSVTADTVEDIWDGGGTYSYPATALMVQVSQTADQAAMRGQTIEVQGLDANWALTVQNVVLNASLTTTPVVMTTPLIRIFRMKVLANVVITSPVRCHNAAESVDYAIMQIGNNQTLMALYTVPAGKTAFMINYFADVTESTSKQPTATEFKLFIADRASGYEFQLKHSRAVPLGGSGFQHFHKPYMRITEKSDIRLTAGPKDQDGYVHAGFDLILIDN